MNEMTFPQLSMKPFFFFFFFKGSNGVGGHELLCCIYRNLKEGSVILINLKGDWCNLPH